MLFLRCLPANSVRAIKLMSFFIHNKNSGGWVGPIVYPLSSLSNLCQCRCYSEENMEAWLLRHFSVVSRRLGWEASTPLALGWFVFLCPFRVCLHCSCSFTSVDMSTHTQLTFSLAVLSVIKPLKNSNRKVPQLQFQPPAQSWVNYEVRPGCSVLFLLESWKPPKLERAQVFWAMFDCANVDLFSPYTQSETLFCISVFCYIFSSCCAPL